MRSTFGLIAAVVCMAHMGTAPAGAHAAGIPSSLSAEHQELQTQLRQAIEAGGPTGAAARDVEAVLHPHFVREEELALPPLGLLVPLSQGKLPADPGAVIRQTDQLKAELPRMLREHQAIVQALERLAAVSKEQGQPRYAQFAEKLILHARTEEEVLYPAAVLVGEYLKLRTPAP